MTTSAAPVVETNTYQSTLSSDANGPLDLKAELNYDDSSSNAPIAVVMHGYSGTSGLFDAVRGNAQYLRDKGFFAVSVAMRQREGSDGIRDSGGLEIYDIYDAVEAVKRDYPSRINPAIVYLTGYSGGGGNTMAAVCKFPDYFNVAAALFGMSDYGYNATNGWYFDGATTSHQSQMRTDIGDPTIGDTNITDRYHARAVNLASANNPYTEIHLFVNATETTCPSINDITFYSNAVSQAAFSGEFSNMTAHIGQSGLYQDFNTNGLNDANEQQYWPHGAPAHDQQDAAENWFMDRLLAGQIPRRPLNSSDRLFVAGFVKTARFECRVGDGQQGALRLDYALTPTNLTFHAQVLSLDKQRVSRLTINTAAFSNQLVDVIANGSRVASFAGGGLWTTESLRDGDTLELRAVGPAVLWWESVAVNSVSATSAWVSATLAGTNAAVWCYCGTNNPGQQTDGWWRSSVLGGDVPTGRVSVLLTNLAPDTTYYVAFFATNMIAGKAAWSDVRNFTTLPPSCKLLAFYDFERDLHDQSTNAFHGTSITSGGAGVTFTNAVPPALGVTSHESAVFDGKSWIALPFLNLYNRAKSGGISVSFWAKGGSTTSTWTLAEGSTNNINPAYCLGPKGVVSTLRAYVRTDAGSALRDRDSVGAVFDGAWHHVAWTDKAGAAHLYIDGSAADTASYSYTPGTLTMNTTTIGALIRTSTAAKYPFIGWIDDFAIWDEALGTNSIAALSAGASPLALAGLLSDPSQPVQITEISLPGPANVSFSFTGPTLAIQPRVWWTTNLSAAEWSPVTTLTDTVKSNGIFHQTYDGAPAAQATFYKVVY